MKAPCVLRAGVVIASMLGFPFVGSPQVRTLPAPQRVVSRPGAYSSGDGSCRVKLVTNSRGGALNLILPAEKKVIAGDVSAMAWISNEVLVYTVIPVYGKPGLYALNCKSALVRRILGPKTFNKAYPGGADYFELEHVSDNGRLLYFYYAPDVETVDFKAFRNQSNLFQVSVDGTQFKKAN